MAVLRRRLHKLTSSGYQTIHYETDSFAVKMANGANLETTMGQKQDIATAINTGNIGGQSVNYANSAGSANSANTAGNADTVDGVHVNTDPGSYGLKPAAAGSSDITAGSTGLANGHIYLVYE